MKLGQHFCGLSIALICIGLGVSILAVSADLSRLRVVVSAWASIDAACDNPLMLLSLDRKIAGDATVFEQVNLTLADAYAGTFEEHNKLTHFEYTMRKNLRAALLPWILSRLQIERAFCYAGSPGGKATNLPWLLRLLRIDSDVEESNCGLQVAIDLYIQQMRLGWKADRLKQEFARQFARKCRVA